MWVNKRINELRAGDVTRWYTVLSDVRLDAKGRYIADVRFADGGVAQRVWHPVDALHEVEVKMDRRERRAD